MSTSKVVHLDPNTTKPVFCFKCSCGASHERYACSCGTTVVDIERKDGKIREFALVPHDSKYRFTIKGINAECDKCHDVLTPY